MTHHRLLLIDSFINLVLGILLIIFPKSVVHWMGLPLPVTRFYVNILGAVFIGIALALAWEARRGSNNLKLVGLGVVGAAAINLCGGAMLAVWLITGKLDLTLAGSIFLWLLVILLVGISTLELIQHRRIS
jgi:fluoride ion exporter CrcB/FEX